MTKDIYLINYQWHYRYFDGIGGFSSTDYDRTYVSLLAGVEYHIMILYYDIISDNTSSEHDIIPIYHAIISYYAIMSDDVIACDSMPSRGTTTTILTTQVSSFHGAVGVRKGCGVSCIM